MVGGGVIAARSAALVPLQALITHICLKMCTGFYLTSLDLNEFLIIKHFFIYESFLKNFVERGLDILFVLKVVDISGRRPLISTTNINERRWN